MNLKSFSIRDRYQAIRDFQTRTFDLLIIGGGINGAGIARDAAMRGLSVALIEADDYASGTSSRSSKLIHGGIRYLENLEFHLVFEALSERAKLFKMAPHMVHPLRFLIPVFRDSRVGFQKMRLGMWLYDMLALFDVPEMHESLNTSEVLEEYPWLKSDLLVGGLRYSDGYMDDDRLVFESLRSAISVGDFACANYVKAIGVEVDEKDVITGVKAQDLMDSREFQIKARKIMSTVGPWTDELRAVTQDSSIKPVLRPTKGIHVTFDRQRFPLKSAVVMGVEDRIVFAIPRLEMVIVGTTDTDYTEDPRQVRASLEDIQYLLSVANHYFPMARLTMKDILASYAGVRPLVRDDAASEGKTSREHSIWTEPSGVTYVAGGKYTTYRLVAEQAVNHALRSFPVSDQVRWSKAETERPLNPLVTEDFLPFKVELAKELQSQHFKLGEGECLRLIERFGPEALELRKTFGAGYSYPEYEALFAVRSTGCINLRDLFFRRVPWYLSEPNHALGMINQIRNVWKESLGLNDDEFNKQVTDLNKQIEFEMAWKKCASEID
jgi:glycerol-3-phosphate dehydrogenase